MHISTCLSPILSPHRPAPPAQVRRVPLRRVAELNALKGSRFAMSLLLELCDLAAPALRTLWRHGSGGRDGRAGNCWRGPAASGLLLAGPSGPAGSASSCLCDSCCGGYSLALLRLRGSWQHAAAALLASHQAVSHAGPHPPTYPVHVPLPAALVSWLLVRLIGQSLGLIYQGIRASIRSAQQAQQAEARAGKRAKGGRQRQERTQPPLQQQQRGGGGAGGDAGSPLPPFGSALWGGAF